jgi:transposase
MAGEFWLDDRQWARLQPMLPNKARGLPRVDDRRVISGIVHVLQSGLPVEGCACDLWAA